MHVRGGNFRRLLALVLAIGLLAAACGGGDDDAGGGGGGSGSDASGGGDIDPEGILKIGYDLISVAKSPFTWDPTEVTTQLTDSGMLYLVYGALMRPTQGGELELDLAQEVTIPDGNTIEITLRDGLTFSDGTPFDAEAVKAGLERTLAATDSTGIGTAFFDLETVEVTSPTQVKLTIPKGTAPSWHDTFMGSWETTIVHPQPNFDKPIGAGPMVVTEYRPEETIKLTKNPDYWDAESILVGGIETVQVNGQEAQAQTGAIGAGQVDMVLIDPESIPAISGDNDVLITPDPNRLMTFMTCKRDEPLSDAKVRRALNKAIDRDAINDAVFDGAYVPAHGLWPEGHRFHDPDVDEAVEYDVAGAKELLAEAGYEDGFSIDMYVLQAGGMPEVTEVVQQQFAEIGVEVTLIPALDYVNNFLRPKKPGLGAVPTMSPNRLKILQWSGASIGNTCGWQDPELEQLEDELAKVSDASDDAAELWHQIEQKAVAEDALSIFLLFGAHITAYNAERLGDVATMPYTILGPDVRKTYVKK